MSREANPYDEGMGSSEGMGERVDDLRERAANLGSKIKDKASQFGTTVSSTVDRQRETAARGLDRAASSLHDGVGSAAKVGHGVADGMESTASYLRSHSFGTWVMMSRACAESIRCRHLCRPLYLVLSWDA